MTPHRAQRGTTLVVALIFLILMSLFAVNAFLGSSTQLRVVGNMQARSEALAAAQVAIERVISSNGFAADPVAVEAQPIAVDMDHDGSADYSVRMIPRPHCYRAQPVKNQDLDASGPGVVCLRSSVITAGPDTGDPRTQGSLADNSLCATAEWNLRAEVSDARSRARLAVHQGVGVRMLQTDIATYCQ